jgi:hypothetical protein
MKNQSGGYAIGRGIQELPATTHRKIMMLASVLAKVKKKLVVSKMVDIYLVPRRHLSALDGA